MTIYGWDTSHYDGTLTQEILSRARSEGIAFVTHKIGEGLDNTDPLAAEAFAAGKSAGFQVIGGYYFIHHGEDMVAEAKRCIAVADKVAPFWRTFDGWFWQTDAEVEQPYGLPTPAEVKTFSDTLADLSRKCVIVYASAGMYANRLAGLGHPLWNAHYGANPAGSPAQLYAAQGGDNSAGWDGYSGQVPVLLQFGSRATIAGLTTCDANAFRGTIDQLLEQIMATVDVTPASQAAIAGAVVNTPALLPNPDADASTLPKTTLGTGIYRLRVGMNALLAGQAAAAKTESATLAAVQALGKVTGVDPQPILDAINAVGAEESAAVTKLLAEIDDLEHRLAAAEQAAAAALAAPGTE